MKKITYFLIAALLAFPVVSTAYARITSPGQGVTMGEPSNYTVTPTGGTAGTLAAKLAQSLGYNLISKSDSYQLAALGDCNKAFISMGKDTPQTLTLPLNSTLACPVGSEIIAYQSGAGALTIAVEGGVTFYPALGSIVATGQYSQIPLKKIATNTWVAKDGFQVAAAATTLYGNTSTASATPGFTTAPVVSGIMTAANYNVTTGNVGVARRLPANSTYVYMAGPLGTSSTTSNTNTIASDTLYLSPIYLPPPYGITRVGMATSSTNASVGAEFKACIYGSTAAGLPTGSPLGKTTSGTVITDSATATGFDAALDSAASVPATMPIAYAGLIFTTSTTAVRPAKQASGATFVPISGATTLANAVAGTSASGFSATATYANGCPNPVGALTVVTGSNPPAVFFTVQ